MSEWKEYRLGDICEIFAGGDAPKEKYSKLKTNEYNIPIFSNGITDEGLYGYTDKARVLTPATTITARGTVGVVFRRKEPYFPIVRLISVIGNKELLDSDFLYYKLKSTYIDGEGSVQAQLTVPMISNYRIDIPSLEKQRSIASILSALDEKIAVNRRICENLEAQAQALFKNWFIDFAPFKDGKFVESELGMIPEGWRVGTLGDIAEFKRGKTITKSETKDGTIPVVAGGLEPAYYHSQSNTSSRVITISGSGANAGFIRMYYQPVWASDCSFLDNSSTALLHTAYCYLKTNKKKVDALQWGAAQPHVYAKDINKLPFVIPPLEILNQFELLITEMFDCIEVNDKENQRLATLRDTLLPKLMSGELKVNEIETKVI